MTSLAIVEKIENGRIIVSTVRKGGCGDNCAMCGGCNAEKVLTEVYSDKHVCIGDKVEITSDTKYVIFALFVLFLLPVCAPLLTFLLSAELASPFQYGLTASIFILSIIVVFVLSKSSWFIKKITPKITDIIKKK